MVPDFGFRVWVLGCRLALGSRVESLRIRVGIHGV